jgi:translation initiation factor eIF-2B subunit delta
MNPEDNKNNNEQKNNENKNKEQTKQPKKKKEKTKEEKEEARKKAAEKKRLKKEEAAKKEQELKLQNEKNQTQNDENKNQNNENKHNKKKEKEKENESQHQQNKKTENIHHQHQIRKIYALTTYEERIKEKNSKENLNPKISSKYIIKKLLSKKDSFKDVNEDLIYILVKLAKCGSHKQESNCLELLNAFKNFIEISNEKTNGEYYEFVNSVKNMIDEITNIINENKDIGAGVFNTLEYLTQLKYNINDFQKDVKTIIIKNYLIEQINIFIKNKIQTKSIISDKSANHLIQNNDVILIYGKSKIFRNILLSAHKNNIKFKIIFVDNRRENHMIQEIEFFAKLGISVEYTYLNGVVGLIKNVTKVFIKAKSMLSNGYLQGQVGTSLLCCIANYFNKHVIAFCQTYKFWDKIMLNSIEKNNFNNIIEEYKDDKLQRLELNYDITPAIYINMVVCEFGSIPSTSVPVLIREFGLKQI